MSDFNASFVNDEIIEKWMPIIEGQDKWKSFVSACPKVETKDNGLMAQLFENVEALSEAGTNAADGTGDYSPILIPMMRRIVPALIGPQIFGTQPMNGPTGLIFALQAVYGGDSVGTKLTLSNSVILTLADASLGSSGFAVGTNISNTATAATGLVRHIEGNNILVEVLSGTFAVLDDVDNNIAFGGAETTVSAVYENEALFKIIFSNYTGTMTTPNGEILSTDMKEIDFEVKTETITARTRKLKAKWTIELEQDLKAIHNMNAESLLKMLASDQIVMEMNKEFIDLVRSKVGTTTPYDYDTTADGRWELERYQNLMAMISRVKRQIATSTRRGQATFMIVSPAVLSVLETAGKLKSDINHIATSFAGVAMGMKVFVDLWATNDDIILGYKGSEIDAGIFYGPYIPVQIRKGFGEEDGQPRTFFNTRYGLVDHIFGAENYYKRITCADLPV